jgi:2-polyprenyl-6-methoxyphenol hydroxylase-like FAD-dependent oxidoreductase
MPVRYDVIIVGARVAGAATAALLGRQGLRVLLVDRAPLPGPAVSTHFFARTALEFLDTRLGVLEEVLATGAPPLRRWHIEIEGACYGGPMPARGGHSYNLCVRREALDDILLRAATREAGVELRVRAPVDRLVRDGGRVAGAAGPGWEARAPVVIGADGRGSRVARLAGAGTEFDAGVLRCTYHAYWTGVAPHPEPALELWYSGRDVLQVGPCDAGAWVVMISSPAGDYAALRGDGTGNYLARLEAIPAMRARLRDARRVSPVFGSGTLRNFERVPAGRGWFLAGDAYCLKDPLFGAGITDALRAAGVLAELVPQVVSGALAGDAAAERYRAEVRRLVGEKVKQGLDGLRIDPVPGEQRAWILGALSHPAFALELSRRCSQLFAGLPQDRREFWERAVADTAATFGLPEPARLPRVAG